MIGKDPIKLRYNKDKETFEIIDGNFIYPISEELAEDFPTFSEYSNWLR